VEDLAISKFHGVGPVTAARMKALGIHTGQDLRAQTRLFLETQFGKQAGYYYGVARGIDERPVEADRVRKSVGAETTFARDISDWAEVAPSLAGVFEKLWTICTRGGYSGRTITVKVKHSDFQQITRRRTLADPVASLDELQTVSLDLLRPCFPPARSVRLLGVSLSSLESKQFFFEKRRSPPGGNQKTFAF
jgi:DNA polymerase-4